MKKYPLLSISLIIIIIVGIILIFTINKPPQTSTPSKSPIVFQPALVNIPFIRQEIRISPEISQKFSLSEVKNVSDMEKAYGFKFTPVELAKLEQNKFIIKNLLDTNIPGDGLTLRDNNREFSALYGIVSGDSDYKKRTQANALFISSDLMMNLFSVLSADLLKETENTYLYEQTLSMTKVMYDEAQRKLNEAKSDADRKQWTKVRNYFAIPYALLSTSVSPITAKSYWNSDSSERGISVDEAQADYKSKDKGVDSYEKTSEFVKSLNLGADSEKIVLIDLKQAYEASVSRGTPEIFAEEFKDLPPNIRVGIPFTLFKPRGTYTSSSLRRQYFRAIQWYQQIPFLLSSKDLTNYAVDIGELIHNNPDVENQYKSFSSFIAFIVGEGDDLSVADYASAVASLGVDKAHDQKLLNEYLSKTKPDAKIKAMPVDINSSANITVADELQAIRGMRFMSQKFIPDSYWTSKLTQGDEAPAVSGKKLPDQASMLEVMSMLGSPYATTHLSDLPFYTNYKQAIDTRLNELKSETKGWNDSYWQSNLYTSSLWTVSGLYEWLITNHSALPQFMQSTPWEAKNLLTGSGFWTELRHTSLLYAKQSAAERGGGGDNFCDPRKVPEPAKGYVEPQAEAYDRLFYTAKRLDAEYKARKFDLNNSPKLENYIKLLDTIREYTKLELENNTFKELTIAKTRLLADDNNKSCVEYFIAPESTIKRNSEKNSYLDPVSRWEELRVTLLDQIRATLPVPVEGPIIEMKDKRVAVVADIHTDKDGGVLEEGTGVPRIIFVAVKDANGPRLTVGFTYSQYETISGDRLTDETWQDNFYSNSGSDYSLTYKPKNTWPNINKWFEELLGNK